VATVELTHHLYAFFPSLEGRKLEVPGETVAEVLRGEPGSRYADLCVIRASQLGRPISTALFRQCRREGHIMPVRTKPLRGSLCGGQRVWPRARRSPQ